MRISALRRDLPVPARPLYSRAPDPPDVYRSTALLRDRWVFYALGHDAELLGCRHPQWDETDEEVVARLMDLVHSVRGPLAPACALVNADSIIDHGFDPSFHRPLSLPRLVR